MSIGVDRMPRRCLVVPAVFALALLAPRAASACGVSGAGASGTCSLDDFLEANRKQWRVGYGWSFTDTRIHFSGDRTADETRAAALATLDWRPSLKTTLQVGLGAVLGGHLDLGGRRFDLRPGPELALSASHLLVQAKHGVPFVLVSGTLAASTTITAEEHPRGETRITASDLRVGVTVGEPIARTDGGDVVNAFALGRGFGGPIFWRYGGESVTGTDTHHYQLGVGLSATVLRTVDLYAEGVFLGERGATVGAGLSFLRRARQPLRRARQPDLLRLPLAEEPPQRRPRPPHRQLRAEPRREIVRQSVSLTRFRLVPVQEPRVLVELRVEPPRRAHVAALDRPQPEQRELVDLRLELQLELRRRPPCPHSFDEIDEMGHPLDHLAEPVEAPRLRLRRQDHRQLHVVAALAHEHLLALARRRRAQEILDVRQRGQVVERFEAALDPSGERFATRAPAHESPPPRMGTSPRATSASPARGEPVRCHRS